MPNNFHDKHQFMLHSLYVKDPGIVYCVQIDVPSKSVKFTIKRCDQATINSDGKLNGTAVQTG